MVEKMFVTDTTMGPLVLPSRKCTNNNPKTHDTNTVNMSRNFIYKETNGLVYIVFGTSSPPLKLCT